MRVWSARRPRLRPLLAVMLAAALGLAGCGKKADPEVAPIEADKPAMKAESKPAVAARADAGGPSPRDRLHQPFAAATRAADNPPPDAARPPDATMTKKPAFKILEGVGRVWDDIRFTTPEGKKVHWVAEFETSAGNFQVALFPEQAPNHVRNFIALAKSGYYDGLLFERTRHEEAGERVFRSLEGGCPLGTGESDSGSVGYWLKNEFTSPDKMSHEEGVFGACRGADADTAATRFYITLNKAPFLDGQFTLFGKVVQGLDVVRRIYAAPTIIEEQDPGVRRPQKPVVIHKVTVHPHTEARTN